MHAHGQAARPGRQVIPEQSALAAFIELALGIERQGQAGMTNPSLSRARSWSILAIAHLKMSRLAQIPTALFYPVGDPAQHPFQCD